MSTSGHLARFAAAPFLWTLSQLSLGLGLGNQDQDMSEQDWKWAKGDWVMWDNVHVSAWSRELTHILIAGQTVAEAVLNMHRTMPRLSPLESLYSLQAFQSKLVLPALTSVAVETPSTPLSDVDLGVLLTHLSRDLGAATVAGNVIKLEHEAGQDMRKGYVSEHEQGIVNVKDTHAKLERQVEQIEERIRE